MPPPFVFPLAELKKALATAGTRGTDGLRERAVLLLMFRLGLRRSDIARLKLADIDWPNATLRVSGKNRRAELLPLPRAVGDAILAYLQRARPSKPAPEVFLLAQAPYGPLGVGAVGAIRRFALARAGLRLPETRAHVTRHSYATDLLRTNVPLPIVQRLLRHRRLATTGTYCQVDQAQLRTVCQPWPGPCPT